MVRIAILASGSGSNAEEIIRYMNGVREVEVAYVLTNRPQAGVFDRVKCYGIPTRIFIKQDWKASDRIISFFKEQRIDLIVLAGYLQKIPKYLIRTYPDRIVNIHPALLPSYGGKGMYGMHVHEAVHRNREKFSGITIHLVNEKYDDGEIIFQARCPIHPEDSPEQIRTNVLALEHQYFPTVVKYLACGLAKSR